MYVTFRLRFKIIEGKKNNDNDFAIYIYNIYMIYIPIYMYT